MKLNLAEGLSLPLDTVTEKLAWLGRTGSGKTYGAMKLAELMLAAGAQIGALDPVGVWRALRVPAEKGGASFEVVVFGGLYGDLPLEPHAGELIADLVCDRGLSFVLDVSQFIPSEQQRFVQAFGARFFHRKKSAPSAVHLFIEECQEFIPENPSGAEATTLGIMQRLWKLGRNFGIGGSLISQRPQEIAKKALNMSGTLFAFQMTGPQERKAVKAWVADHGIAVDIESVLQTLRVGEPHVESPTFLAVSKTVRILPRVTADLSSTPKVGASTAAKRPLTPIDVEQLKTSMAATIEKAKADDPRELRKQIAELRRELEAAKRLKVPVEKPENLKVSKPVLTDADRALLDKLASGLGNIREFLTAGHAQLFDEAHDRMLKVLHTFRDDSHADIAKMRGEFERRLETKTVQQILGKLSAVNLHPTPPHDPTTTTAPRSPQARPVATAPATSGRTRLVSNSDTIVRKGERAILTAAAQYPKGVTREQLTVLTGYKRSSRDTYLQRLTQAGLAVANGDGRIYATDVGVAALGDFEPLPTGDELRAHWLSTLPEGERRILEVLTKHYPQFVDREALDEATGYKRSSRDTYLQRLGARQLIETERGAVRASQELFA